MSKIEDGGPAFAAGAANESTGWTQEGMSLRDWFAGQALSGICASGPATDWTNDLLASEAYSLADAMLAARSTDKEKE